MVAEGRPCCVVCGFSGDGLAGLSQGDYGALLACQIDGHVTALPALQNWPDPQLLWLLVTGWPEADTWRGGKSLTVSGPGVWPVPVFSPVPD